MKRDPDNRGRSILGVCGWLANVFSWPFGAIAFVVEWAATPAGLRTQAVGAFACQLVGFAILVVEIVEARRDFRLLIDRFRKVDEAMAEQIRRYRDAEYWRKDPGIVELMERGNTLPHTWRAMGQWMLDAFVGAFVTPPMRVGLTLYANLWAKIHLIVVQSDVPQHPWRPWIGAAFLLLGIIFQFTGQFLGIH